MAFARLAFFPDGTEKQHAALVAETGHGTATDGRLAFAAGQVPGGWQTVQVWTSFEALAAFDTDVFRPALQRLGAAGFPEVPHVVDFEATDLEVRPERPV